MSNTTTTDPQPPPAIGQRLQNLLVQLPHEIQLEAEKRNGYFYVKCIPCEQTIRATYIEKHLKTKKHNVNVELKEFCQILEQPTETVPSDPSDPDPFLTFVATEPSDGGNDNNSNDSYAVRIHRKAEFVTRFNQARGLTFDEVEKLNTSFPHSLYRSRSENDFDLTAEDFNNVFDQGMEDAQFESDTEADNHKKSD